MHRKAGDQAAGQKQHEAIDDKRKKSQGDDVDGQREQKEDRPDKALTNPSTAAATSRAKTPEIVTPLKSADTTKRASALITQR